LDKNIVSTICELIELIGEGGDKKRQAPINIDFNSLKSILEGKGQSVFLGSAFSTAGKVNNLVKKIFQGENKPLLILKIFYTLLLVLEICQCLKFPELEMRFTDFSQKQK